MTEPSLIVSAELRRDDFVLPVELAVGGGEVLGLSGDIGSGKSSVLALIAGRLRASAGTVSYGDQRWDDTEASTFVTERPVALLSQSYQNDLPEDLTGTDVVSRAVAAVNPTNPDPETTARAVLAALGVGDHVVDRLPWTFSGAEAQRIALARAAAPKPPVLLLDEPFGAMDKRTGAEVRRWLAEWLVDYPGVVVIASTRVDHLDELTHRIVSLDASGRSG